MKDILVGYPEIVKKVSFPEGVPIAKLIDENTIPEEINVKVEHHIVWSFYDPDALKGEGEGGEECDADMIKINFI